MGERLPILRDKTGLLVSLTSLSSKVTPMQNDPSFEPAAPAHHRPASQRSRPVRRKKMSTLTKTLMWVGSGLLALILIGVLLTSLLRGGEESASEVPATDYLILTSSDVSNRVRVEGYVSPGTVESVTTHLTSPISSVTVEPGDRVELGQTLATIDASALQGELDSQRTTLDGQVTSAQSALTAAQGAYDNYSAGINNGTNPDILAAQGAQRTANEQLTVANDDLSALREALATSGNDPALATEVRAAESAQRIAAGAKADADTGITTARSAADTQLATLATELETARSALTTAQTTRDQALEKLQDDINSATISSPINGVVMNVAKPGAPATGPVVTIGDDSKLTITTKVREADIASIKEGNKVTFTSGSTGSKEYTGTVTSVASIADSVQQSGSEEAASAGMSGAGSSDPTFTVEIEVTGDREGLQLGSSVKAQIITAEEASTLSLPLDAVYTTDAGTKGVVVAVPTDSGAYTLEERSVETGLANDVDVAVTGGDVAEGDMVLTPGEKYRSQLGQNVTLGSGRSW